MKGLKARGGFEIDIEWKNSKFTTKLVVRSALGGNGRIRTASNLILKSKTKLISAEGENSNEYYQVNPIKSPLKSNKADLKKFIIPTTQMFDVKTEKRGIYTFKVK